MRNEWMQHDGSEQQPEKSRGLTAVDVQYRTGATGLQVDPRMVTWSAITNWRRSATLAETLEAAGQGRLPVDGVQDTLNERGKTHGNFIDQATQAQVLKDMVTRGANYAKLSNPQREALETICTKMSRILNGNPNEPDHWRDIAGYATLVENILVHGKSHLG